MRSRAGATRKPEQTEGRVEQDLSPPRSRRDELTYLTDMVRELSIMAVKLGCPTLAGILALARREAQLERDRA